MAEVLNDINNDTRTVIGLRHLDEIKAYVDGRIGEVSGEVTEEINEYLQNQLDAAKDKIEKDTENKLKDLKDKLDQAILEGDESAIRDLQLKIDVLTEDLNTKFEAIDAINGELDRINGKYGDLSNSIFTPGEIDELIKTAFIDGTYITNDSVTTPNVFTTKLVALIAKFGKIKAANIEAGAITGHTISCDNLDKNGNPMWSLNEDGSGNLAGDNITWDKNGKVELGKDVTLSWKSVDNTGNPALDKLNKLENAQNDLKDIINNGFQNIVSGWIEDGVLNPTEIKAIKSELEKITSNYELLNRYLDEIIDIYATAKTSDIDKEVKTKYYEDLKVAKKKLSDAYIAAKSVCEYYINANGNSIGTIKLNAAYDLNKVNKYYEVQNEVTLFYQEANNFYTTDNRFGSKLTYIGEDGIYSGKISGDQITGWRLRGLTMESAKTTTLPDYINWYKYNHNANNEEAAFDYVKGGNGPTWQISKDGDGYLAGGQISWSDQNITLGDKVRINWKQVDEVPEGLEDLKAEVDENYKTLCERLNIDEKEISELIGSRTAIEANLLAIKTSIDILNNALDRIESGETPDGSGEGSTTVLTGEDIKFIAAALQKDPVFASAIWTGRIAAAQGVVEDFNGTYIKGIELSSYDNVTLTDGKSGPAWKLQNNGSGYLAKGNIKWDTSGTVTLGKGVTINWEDINGRPGVDDNGNISLDDEKIKSVVKTTQLGAYSIGSGTVAANLVQSRTSGNIESGTKYYEIDNNGVKGSYKTATTGTSAPLWQIDEGGSGYLSKGNIRWDEDGKLEIKGDVLTGSTIGGAWNAFEDGGINYVGDGTSKNTSTNYFGENGTFKIGGSDGLLKENEGSNISIGSAVEFSGGTSTDINVDDAVDEYLNKTIIDGDYIRTNLINAKALTVGALNTKDNGGTLRIGGNDIEVYDKNSNNIILNITGDEIVDISATSSGSTKNVSISYTYTNKIYNDFSANLYDLFTNTDKSVAKYDEDQQFYYLKVGNFTIPNDGYSYKFGNSTATANLSLSFRTENTSIINTNIGNIELYYDFVILKNGEIFNKMDNYSNVNIKFSNGNFSTSYSQRFLFNGQAITNNTYISSGDYKIYFRYKFNEGDLRNENLKYCKLNTDGFYASINNMFTISGSSIEQSKFNIGSNGFNYSISNDRYIQFTEDKNFIITNGGNTIMLDDTGNIWMGFNNDNEIDKDLNTATTARKLNVYKVVPRTYKFRLQGDKNQWMTVLTLGETKEVN